MAASKMVIYLAAGLERGDAAFHAGHHQVLDAHVGKGAARHDAVVAAARAVAVEILESHAVLEQVFAGGRSFLDAAGGGDVVGRDAVAKNAQRRGRR